MRHWGIHDWAQLSSPNLFRLVRGRDYHHVPRIGMTSTQCFAPSLKSCEDKLFFRLLNPPHPLKILSLEKIS